MSRNKKQRTQDEQQALDVTAQAAHSEMLSAAHDVAHALQSLRECEVEYEDAATAYRDADSNAS